jgi:hypothetical protein
MFLKFSLLRIAYIVLVRSQERCSEYSLQYQDKCSTMNARAETNSLLSPTLMEFTKSRKAEVAFVVVLSHAQIRDMG